MPISSLKELAAQAVRQNVYDDMDEDECEVMRIAFEYQFYPESVIKLLSKYPQSKVIIPALSEYSIEKALASKPSSSDYYSDYAECHYCANCAPSLTDWYIVFHGCTKDDEHVRGQTEWSMPVKQFMETFDQYTLCTDLQIRLCCSETCCKATTFTALEGDFVSRVDWLKYERKHFEHKYNSARIYHNEHVNDRYVIRAQILEAKLAKLTKPTFDDMPPLEDHDGDHEEEIVLNAQQNHHWNLIRCLSKRKQ